MLRSTLRFLAVALFGVVVLVGANPAGAASLPEPTDKPILTVTGKIEVTNKDGTAQFDRAMLKRWANLILHRNAVVQGRSDSRRAARQGDGCGRRRGVASSRRAQ